jgi:tryptophan halogenase
MIKSNILVLGGGTAGLVTALILKTRFPKKEISVVKSDKIGVIGVGEGSNEEWSYFVEFCGLDSNEVIRETDATVKLGIKYVNWTDKDYIHNVDNRFYENSNIGQLAGSYIHNYINDESQIDTTDDLIAKAQVPNINQTCSNQYHFNALKLRDYLEKKCRERHIKVYTDEIKDVIQNDNGIDYITGEKQYKSDFYIDSSGFKKVLIGKLGVKWNSYAEYLPVNEAIAFPTDDTDEYPLYTSSTAMKYGWMWNTPVYGRWGNGYVFDSNYINAEEAQKEAEEYLGHKIEFIFKNIKFSAGSLDKFWVKNCMAVGLSSNFIEPLEATSIGSTITQAFMFMNYYDCANDLQIKQFNDKMAMVIENLRDFVILHYQVKKNDTEFWSNLKHLPIPPSLQHKLDLWKDRLPIREDFPATGYCLFYEMNFISIMYGLKLLNKEVLTKIYDGFSDNHKLRIKNNIQEYNNIKNKWKNNTISHKKWLAKVRGV